MRDFVTLVEDLDATNGTNEKIALIAAYLEAARADDAAWAAYLLIDRRRKRPVSSRRLRDIFLAHSDIPEWLFKESHAHVGDTAEAVTLLIRAGYLRGYEPPAEEGDGETATLTEWMERRIGALAALDREACDERVVEWWRAVGGRDLFVMNKLITGGFRLGVSRATVVRAVAAATGVDTPVVTRALTGGFTPSADFFDEIGRVAAGDTSRPYPFFLASPLPEEMVGTLTLSEWRIEWKWDGIRAQIVKRSGEVTIWSRGEELVAEQFPEIAEAAGYLADGTVLDAEIVAWRGDGPRPFHDLQRRLGRKRVGRSLREGVPVVALVFDCLEIGGHDIREEPLEERIAARDSALSEAREAMHTDLRPILAPSDAVAIDDWAVLEEERRVSRERNVEGFILKRLGSPYRQGRRRGDWWKFKRDPLALDAVLLYAQAGSGKRANLFTDYTFALRGDDGLVPFAKAYSGLSNEEIAELDRWIRRHTEERFGPVRRVAATRVFEIGFEGIGPSSRHKSGIATRFPRILRPRPDKSVDEIDTLADARRLIR